MSSDKDDITRIEDLSEFIHNEEEDFVSLDDQSVPDDIASIETDPNIDLNSFDLDSSSQDVTNELAETSFEETNEFEVNDEDPFPISTDDEQIETEDPFDFSNAENSEQIEELSSDNLAVEETNIFEEEDFNDDFTDNFEENIVEEIEEEDLTSKMIPEMDLKVEPVIETDLPVQTKTEIVRSAISERPAAENFAEVKEFAETLSYNSYGHTSNPPFSVILKNIKYFEEVDEVINVLLRNQFIKDDMVEQTRLSLERGQLLIPRLGEFAAITLCHKLRMFDLEILMGLTEEIHPAKSYESNDAGFSSKASLYGNKKESFDFENRKKPNEVLTSTLNHLDGYSIAHHLGVMTETLIIKSSDLNKSKNLEHHLGEKVYVHNKEFQTENIKDENKLASASSREKTKELGNDTKAKNALDDLYDQLTQALKNKAMALKANGVIGISFSIVPVQDEDKSHFETSYQILSTGNAVWLEKR